MFLFILFLLSLVIVIHLNDSSWICCSFPLLRVTLAVLWAILWMTVCTWREWWAGVTAVPAETSQASTQTSQNSGAGSRRRLEYNLLGDYNELWEILWTVLDSQATNILNNIHGITQALLCGAWVNGEMDVLTCFCLCLNCFIYLYILWGERYEGFILS